MADIRLVKPQANAVHNVPCATGNRFVLDFPSDAALFAKDGDDLVLSFEDGSSIRLQDFYTTYSKEEMPSFEMEGAEISGEDFFAALGNPDLMPAAGPSAAAATRGGGFNQYGDVELLQGIDRLGGLDISFNWGQEHEDDLYAYGHRDIDYGVSVVPVVPGILDPDIPVVDDPDNPNDGGVGPVVDRLEVWEEGLANGSNPQGENVPTMTHGGMNISAPDGVATIVIGTVTVFANGHLVRGSDGAPVKVDTGEGYLQVTGFNPATGRLEYTYTLTSATQEHGLSSDHDEEFAHKLTVTVTDSDGDRGSSTIAVVIRDDEPEAENDYNILTAKENQDVFCSGNVLTGEVAEGEGDASKGDVIGADGHMNDASRVRWETDGLEPQNDNTYKTEYGTITLFADGTYNYVLDGDNDAVRDLLATDDPLQEQFTYTITDADGDTAKATLTITIKGSLQFIADEVVVDEADLENGNTVGSDPAEDETKGSFRIVARDGLQTLTINEKPVKLSFTEDGIAVDSEVQYLDGENGYLTIESVEEGNGSYTVHYIYHLTNATEHDRPADDTLADRNELASEKLHLFEVEATDGNNEKSSGQLKVQILDDIPVLVGSPDLEGTTATVSEDNLGADGASVTIELGNAFENIESKYGADGAAKENAAVYSLRLSGESVSTNLYGLVGEGEEADYAPISLVQTPDGVIQGVANGTVCFTIQVDPKTGEATFTLLKPVQHKEGSDTIGLETTDGSLFCVYTIMDADGDKAEAILEIGNDVFKIDDAQTLVEKKGEAQLAVDESFAAMQEEEAADRLTEKDDTREDDDNFATDMVAFFDAKDLFTITSGADDQGLDGYAVEHNFELKIGENGIESGLQGLYVDGNETTQDKIFLFQNEDGSIVGRVGGETGPAVFTLTINPQSGEMKLELSGDASIVHDETAKFDEAVDLVGKIQVELTVIDRDKDKDTAYADVTLTFEDDGPALSMPDASNMQTTTDANNMGTITGHMDIDFGADGPAQENAMVVTVMEGKETYTFVCEQGENGTWFAQTGEGSAYSFSVDEEGNFTYSRPVSADGTDDDVKIIVKLTDGDGDSIEKMAVEYAPTITVDKDEGEVREKGVAGHTYNDDPNDNLEDPNDDVSAISSTSGTITLAQSESGKKDSGDLTLSLRGGSITHTTLTLERDDEDATVSIGPVPVGNFGDINPETTLYLYLVKGEDGIVLSRDNDAANSYGSITFTKNKGSDTWTWKFDLAENNLVNSMTEREEIHLSLNLGVSDGMLQNSGNISITIKGTNDKPEFVVGTNDYNEAGKNLVTDPDGGVSGVEHSISGTLMATDPDTDNGDLATAQQDNHLIFSLVGFKESKVGTVGEGGKYTEYGSDDADRINNLKSNAVSDEEGNGSTSITTKYGTLTVKPDGTFTYEPSDTSPIGKDEYVTETFTVRVTDAHGSWTTKEITITLRDEDASVTGTDVSLNAKEEGVVGNDLQLEGDYNAPVSTQGGAPEAGEGTVLFTDEDLNDTLTLTSTTSSSLKWNGETYLVHFPGNIEVGIAGTSTELYLVAYNDGGKWSFEWTESKQGNQDIVGSLTLERTGTGEVKASFALDPQNITKEEFDNSEFLDQLVQNETVTVELPLQATSSGGDKTADSMLTINIEGTNDKPVIDSVTDNQKLTDQAEEYTYPTEGEDSEGSGESSGASKPDLVGFVTAHDVDRDNGSGQSTSDIAEHGLVFTLNKEFVCSTEGASQIEQSAFQEEGSIAFNHESYVGNFDNQYTTIKTTYGTLEIDPKTGEFTYTLDKPERDENGNPNPIMELGEGQSVTETYTVRVTDSHGSWTESEIKITIEGTNDRPVIITQGLEVHGAEENTPDSAYYHPETHPEEHSTAKVEAKDYDHDDTYSYLFVSRDQTSTEPIKITASQLLAALQEPAQERFDGDPNALLVLKAYLEQDPEETVATLNLAADGTLTLIPNQQADFVQALNAADSVSFSLSKVTGYEVAVKDSHNALSDSVDVTLVLHGTDDSHAATSVTVPHVKEDGVYRNNENAIQETVRAEDEPGYGEELATTGGFFTVHDKDAGQIVFKTKDGETVIGEETSTQFGDKENIIDFELSSGSGEGPMYVLGKYGYYTIQLNSVMDPDTGSKTFKYTYSLYSEEAPEDVIEQLDGGLDAKLELVDSIPQGEKVKDPVTIKVNTGGKEDTALSLSATVSGSNDKPFINKVLSYNDTSEEGYTSLKVVSETPNESNPDTIYFDKEAGTLHITLQSNSNGNSDKYIAQIKGLDPDKPLKEGDEADGTTVVNYAFVYTNEEGSTVSNVWSIDGSEATSKYGTISIDAKGVIRIELNKDAGKDISQGKWEDIFDGLGVRCIDDLGATSEVVTLSGKLVGVDDKATAIASNESLWEGQHDSDAVHSPKPYEGEQDRVLADSEGHKLIGSISVTDPDKDDEIGSDVTVTITINGQEHPLDLSAGVSGRVPGQNGQFSFRLEYPDPEDGSRNEAILHYTYTYTGDPEDLDHLNIGAQDTLENVKVSFTSGPEENRQPIESGITITAKGTNDAPVITAVNDDKVSDTGEPYSGGNVPYNGQVTGDITFRDVDNEDETYCGFLTYTDPTTNKVYYLYGETAEDGKTVYKAWYPSDKADDFDESEITYEDLVLTNRVELKHGTLYVNDQGHYIYSRKPGDTNTDPENVYVTVSDPHGAMDSVKIEFNFEDDKPGGKLPAIDMNDDVNMPVTEPSKDGDRVYAGEEGSFVSSFDEGIRDNFELTLYYTTDDSDNPQLVYRDGQDGFKDSNGEPVENPLEATGILVSDGNGGYTWAFKDDAGNRINFEDFYLEIRFTDPNEESRWEDGTYSMSTDYGTVYVDRETGEIRYELDSRADALNAGQKVSDTVAVWINGHKVTGNLVLEVTGTGDASLVEAPALHVDLDHENPADSGTLQIDDIDNSDTGGVNDTHSLEIKLSDGTVLAVEEGGTSIYVVAVEDEPGYKLVQNVDDEDSEALYGTLTFTQNEYGYHYTFTPDADSEASKNLKGGATIAFEIPLTVTDTSPKATESEGDYNNPTTSKTDLVITLEGKADEPDISGVFNIGITEEGGIPEDSQGASAGPDSHAVQGKLVIEDYNEGYSISGVSGDESTFENGSTVIEGTYGTLVLKQDGSYTYTLKYDEVQSLRAGQEEKDIFTVRVDNGAGQHTDTTITVDVIGENDLPTVTVTPVLSVQEQHGAKPSVSGKVEAQDIDKGDTLTYGIMADDTFVTPTGEEQKASVYVYANEDGGFVFQTDAPEDPSLLVGTLTMDQDGIYTFAPADSDYVRVLDAGESINFTVPVGAKDLHGDPVTKPVSITIHGSNENPEITTVIEISENEMLKESPTGPQYTLTIAPGNHNYSATDAEGGTEGLSYTFERNGEYLTHADTTVTTADGKTYNVSLDIDENGKISLSYGDDLRAAIDALGQDKKLTLASDLNVVVQDGSGGKSSSVLELTVTGDNDAPTDLEASVGKDGLEGSLSFVDVDVTDEHTITFDGLYAKAEPSAPLSIETDRVPSEAQPVYDEDGKYLGTIEFSWNESSKTLGYTLDTDPEYLNSLPVEEDVTIPFSVTVTDSHGETVKKDGLKFTVVNKNDAPVLVKDQSDNDEVNEGTIVFTDADLLDSHSVVFDRLQDENGKPLVFQLTEDESSQQVFYNGIAVGTLTVSYTISAEGNKVVEYSFAPTTDKNVLNNLPLGENRLEFSASIKDAQGELSLPIDHVFVVTNDNDEPSINITENSDGFSGTLTITDPDDLDKHTISVLFDNNSFALGEDNTITIDELGTLTFTQQSDGVWDYDLDVSNIAADIPEGDHVDKTFKIQVSDTRNGIATSGAIHVTVEGTNEAPTAESPTYEVTVDNLAQRFSVDPAALARDAEEDELTLSITGINTDGHVTGIYGTLSYDAETGSYSYALDTSDDTLAAIEAAIEAAQPLSESFDYTVSDGVNAPVQGTITLNLDLSGLELPVLPEEPEETPDEGETTIPSQGDSSETDTDEGFKAMVYAIENGEDDTLLFARDTYSLADGEEMYLLSPDDPEENTIDIVAYDSTDYMVDGGEGVSFMVSDNEDLTMDDILQGDGQHGPIVSNIDVLITGAGAESLTNMDQLARDYGISVDKDANSITLDESWQKVDSGHTDTQVFSNGSLTLETSLDVSLPSDDLNVQAAMNQVNNN